MIYLATTTPNLVDIPTIWQDSITWVNTLVFDVIPHNVPALLLIGAFVLAFGFGRRLIFGIK